VEHAGRVRTARYAQELVVGKDLHAISHDALASIAQKKPEFRPDLIAASGSQVLITWIIPGDQRQGLSTQSSLV